MTQITTRMVPFMSIIFVATLPAIVVCCHFAVYCLRMLFVVSADLRDFDPNRNTHGYVSEFCFVQNQTEELEDKISAVHKRLA